MINSFKSIMHIILILMLPVSFVRAQSFEITAYIDSDVIRQTDMSLFQGITFSGQEFNWVFDRRIDDWSEINTYVFDVIYSDETTIEVQVNPEFGSVSTASLEAEKYAFILGQLPAALRSQVNKIWIHQGTESFGGGFNAILIHTGQSVTYESLGILEEVLFHEATHTSLDPTLSTSSDWLNAQDLDEDFISTYAASNPVIEDLAESFLAWFMVRQCNLRISESNATIISQSIPNRLAFFDNQNFNMYPLCIDESLGVINFEEDIYNISIYPNPTTGIIKIKSNVQLIKTNYMVYDLMGKMLIKGEISSDQSDINLNNLSAGIYLLAIGKVTNQTFKIIKQ